MYLLETRKETGYSPFEKILLSYYKSAWILVYIHFIFFDQNVTGAPAGQPKIKPPEVTVGIDSNVTLTCNTDQMDPGNPLPSYTIWTKVLYVLHFHVA